MAQLYTTLTFTQTANSHVVSLASSGLICNSENR